MHTLRLTILAAAAALALTAQAETQYTNVTLADGITIDIPSVVAGKHKSPGAADTGDLMFITLTAGGGDMDCLFMRSNYGETLKHATIVERFKTKTHGGLCAGAGNTKTISDMTLEALDASESNGRPAGTCVASYTDSSKKPPGRVSAAFAVADAKAFYMLSCEISADTQDDAMADWYVRWSKTIERMEKSLHLPPP